MKALQNPVSMRPIKSLCRKITSGGTPSRKSPEFFKNGTVPWVKTGELGDATIEPTGVSEWITQFALQNSSAKLFGANTILMAMYGDGKTIGRLGFVQIPVSSNQACCALICNPTICEPWFLFYALMDRRTDLIRLAHGGAQRNLSCRIIGDYEIPLPRMRHQKSAAKTLRGYDDIIENNTRRIAILEEMARRIFEEWFVHFRAPGCEGLPVVESAIGPVPQGWEVGTLRDVIVLQRGFDLPTSKRGFGLYPVIAATGAHGRHSEFKVHGPGVVTGRSGSLGTVLHIEKDFWPLNTTLWGKAYPIGSTYFAFFILSTLNLLGLNGGAAVPTLNRNDVHKLPVVLPPIRLVRQFDDMMRPMFRLQTVLSSQNANLRAQRDFLLPKLISGEIEIDPASASLKEAAE